MKILCQKDTWVLSRRLFGFFWYYLWTDALVQARDLPLLRFMLFQTCASLLVDQDPVQKTAQRLHRGYPGSWCSLKTTRIYLIFCLITQFITKINGTMLCIFTYLSKLLLELGCLCVFPWSRGSFCLSEKKTS